MKKSEQWFLRAFFVLTVVLLPDVALGQRQSRTSQPSQNTPQQEIDNFIYVLQPMTLGCELPGANLHLVLKGVASAPIEGCEYIYLGTLKE